MTKIGIGFMALALCAAAEAQVYLPKEVATAAPSRGLAPDRQPPRPAAVEEKRDMPLFESRRADAAPKRPARPDFSHVGLPCEPKPRMCSSVIE